MASSAIHYDGTTTSFEYSSATTEWQDILYKKGIIEKPEDRSRKHVMMRDRVSREAGDAVHVEEEDERDDDDDLLDALEEEMGDDDMLKRFREARIAEMKQAQSRDKFGEVRPIDKPEWVVEVTEASADVTVIVYLWQHSNNECKLMDQILPALAARHKHVKFCSIRADAAVENWPDSRSPTLFVYSDGELQHTITKLTEFGKMRSTVDSVEWRLAQLHVLDTKQEKNPLIDASECNLRRNFVDRRGKFAQSDDEEDSDVGYESD